jgi:hypothetical protein
LRGEENPLIHAVSGDLLFAGRRFCVKNNLLLHGYYLFLEKHENANKKMLHYS